jgi:3-deoxy-manno-octulosonate cytidylyltransferase (CMP-KDO synthetase)
MLRIVASAEPPRPRTAIVIPARFNSTRFPGKPLTPLRGAKGGSKSLIERSWDAARTVVGASEIWIATDDPRIEDAARAFGAQVVLTPPECRNGTERCWAAVTAAGIDADLIVNLQGDAPLTPPLAVEALIDTMRDEPTIDVATPMVRCSPQMVDRLKADSRADRVGGTTVVFDHAFNALYFSKQVLPYVPERTANPPVYLHMGVYGYRRPALAAYAADDPCALEQLEGLEQLRFVHAGVPIRMVEVSSPPGGLWEVNNPVDVVHVEAALAERHLD